MLHDLAYLTTNVLFFQSETESEWTSPSNSVNNNNGFVECLFASTSCLGDGGSSERRAPFVGRPDGLQVAAAALRAAAAGGGDRDGAAGGATIRAKRWQYTDRLQLCVKYVCPGLTGSRFYTCIYKHCLTPDMYQ